jgi:hypothetical protein
MSICPSCGTTLHDLTRTREAARVVAILAGTSEQERQGLLGWARVEVGSFRFDGLAIRRRLDGEVIVTYPARKDGRGSVHPAITPLDPELDRRIKASILSAYVAARARHGRSAS